MKNTYQKLRPIVSKTMQVLFRPEISFEEEIPEKGKILLAGNHISNIDPLLLTTLTKRQIHFMAKQELFDSFLKPLMESVESIPVKRNANDINCVRMAIDYLNQEKCVLIFPEGTTNKTDNILLPFKLGTVLIAKRSKAPIFPFAITGQYKLIKNNLKLKVGKRIDPNLYTSNELLEKIESDVKRLILKR